MNKTMKERILLWILDGQSESGSSIVLNVQLRETGEKIMESPVVNLTIWPFSKDTREIPDLLNKYLETATQNRVGPTTNSLKPYRQLNLRSLSRSSFFTIENNK